MQSMSLPMQFKAASDGAFSGHAAVFGNTDLGGDVIERGAFKEVKTNAAGRVVVLWQHDHHVPIGTAEVTETAKGLHFDGQLVLDDPIAKAAHAHMRAGSVKGMSIGYDVLPGGSQMTNGVRRLSSLKLWEISCVTFGMNPGALIDSVKSLPADIRAFERLLRDLGYSQTKACAIASRGFHLEEFDRDDALDPLALQGLAERLAAFRSSIKES